MVGFDVDLLSLLLVFFLLLASFHVVVAFSVCGRWRDCSRLIYWTLRLFLWGLTLDEVIIGVISLFFAFILLIGALLLLLAFALVVIAALLVRRCRNWMVHSLALRIRLLLVIVFFI